MSARIYAGLVLMEGFAPVDPWGFRIWERQAEGRRISLSSATVFDIDVAVADHRVHDRAGDCPVDISGLTMHLLIGERKLRRFAPAIRELRLRCGQQEDRTTDPHYFIAANAQNDRRVAAVLIRREHHLEGCVLFFEHTKFGMGLGIMRGGDYIGESLVVGPEALRLHYVHLATQALLRSWRIHGVSLTVRACLFDALEVLGPEGKYRLFSGKLIRHKLPLESTYSAMLAGMGPRTRRGLAGKRRQLERNAHVLFQPVLEPSQALEAMLMLQSRSVPHRVTRFFHSRQRSLAENPEFFCMGMRLPGGAWLSVLSGWRSNRVTYVDFQMNDMHYKKESLSAVMRAFMLDHEIACGQQLINFVGGTSFFLGRYCRPTELCTDALILRPCLRATILKLVTSKLNFGTVYKRLQPVIHPARDGERSVR